VFSAEQRHDNHEAFVRLTPRYISDDIHVTSVAVPSGVAGVSGLGLTGFAGNVWQQLRIECEDTPDLQTQPWGEGEEGLVFFSSWGKAMLMSFLEGFDVISQGLVCVCGGTDGSSA